MFPTNAAPLAEHLYLFSPSPTMSIAAMPPQVLPMFTWLFCHWYDHIHLHLTLESLESAPQSFIALWTIRCAYVWANNCICVSLFYPPCVRVLLSPLHHPSATCLRLRKSRLRPLPPLVRSSPIRVHNRLGWPYMECPDLVALVPFLSGAQRS